MSDNSKPPEGIVASTAKDVVHPISRRSTGDPSNALRVEDIVADERKAWTKEGLIETSSPAASYHSVEEIVEPDDVWIAVMGMTGVGKSTFISSLVGDDIGIGHGLNSATQQLDVYKCQDVFDRNVWLVDTPGFDDTIRSDVEILNEIATFFVKLYDKEVQFSGLIYLHRITDPKMSGTAIKNLELFKLLCGERCFPIIRMVTTRWNELTSGSPEYQDALKRESQLAESVKFFKPMLDRGSKLMKHEDVSQAATKDIIDSLLKSERKIALEIQYEMLTKQLRLVQTAAGRFLDKEQSKHRRKYDDELKEIEASMTEALRVRDEEMLEMLRSERKEAQERQRKLDEDQRDLAATFKQLSARKAREIHADLAHAGVSSHKHSIDEHSYAVPNVQKRPVNPVTLQVSREASSRSIQASQTASSRPRSSSFHASSRKHQSAFERGTLRDHRSTASQARKRGSNFLKKVEDWLYGDYEFDIPPFY